MATATKSQGKSTAQSKRGGARPGAGRKPKAITEMREALIAPRIQTGESSTGGAKSAAEFALSLFEDTMRDGSMALNLRLDCAREVLNRTIGKPRPTEATLKESDETGGGIQIFIPDNGRDPEREAG